MAEVAVIKPDHLGDFVLSLPAYRALVRAFGQFDLYAAPSNRFMAEHYLAGSNIKFHPLQLPHLAKDKSVSANDDQIRDVCKSHETVLYLRDDGALDEFANEFPGRFHPMKRRPLDHETNLQRSFLKTWIGHYSRTELADPDGARWPTTVRHVGLVLSAGFTSNKLPLVFWLKLARLLVAKCGVNLTIIAGPLEKTEASMLHRLLAVDACRIVIGGSDLRTFFAELSSCDVAIGADSGSLHLVSTALPVLGLFTSSPWVRYAPFGRHNRVIAANVPCSPCIQFSLEAFNGCVSRECAGMISPADAANALLSTPGAPSGAGATVLLGPSHYSN